MIAPGIKNIGFKPLLNMTKLPSVTITTIPNKDSSKRTTLVGHDQVSCPKEFSKDSYLQGVFRQYGYNHNQLFVFVCQYLKGIVMKYKGHNRPIFWKPSDIYNLMTEAGFKIDKNLIEIEKVKIKPALGLKKICKNPKCNRLFIANNLGMDFCYWCMHAKLNNINK